MMLARKVKQENLKIWFTILSCVAVFGCVEEIELKTENFESVLVIEANITNENKVQEVLLSRSFRFEDEGPALETGARVLILSNTGESINFTEAEPGRYLSNIEFAAQPNVEYRLDITTREGRQYISSPESMPEQAIIENVYARPIINSFGEPGVAILVDGSNPNGTSNYYRYEYDETYKIIAPFFTGLDLIPADECNVGVIERIQEERICYNTASSNRIILTETTGQTEDRVSSFEVRFISKSNTIIAHRYSILLKQYVISPDAYNYLVRRRDLAEAGNLFSQAQPGFISGNIQSVESPNIEKVVGFFIISPVQSQRIFFDWEQLYPGEERPEIPCSIFSPPLVNEAGTCVLRTQVALGLVKYWDENPNPGPGEGPYFVVRRECGDCTATGTNIVPEFWEE